MPSSYSWFVRLLCWPMILLALALAAPLAWGQEDDDDKEGFETVELITKDRVALKATWYPAEDDGRSVAPIIVVHDEKTTRNDYHLLALALQAKNHSVIVPDLRGYGDSTHVKLPGGQPDQIFNKDMLRPDHYKLMVALNGDMDRVKRFLRERNDEGKLNLNKLCVIGVGSMGSVIATNWAAVDWSVPDLVGKKQGRDVKALVLVSPDTNFMGLTMSQPLQFLAKQEGPNKKPTERLSFFLVVGAGKPAEGRVIRPGEYRTAQTFKKIIGRYHKQGETAEQVKSEQTLFFGEVATTLQGGELVGDRNGLQLPVSVEPESIFKPVPLLTMLTTFVEWRLVAPPDEELPWSSRE